MPFQVVESQRLYQQVAEQLGGLIDRGEFREGDRLPPERELSKKLGVSRPVVREAMRMLAATGLVELAAGKRATIVAVDGEMISRVIENAVLVGQANAADILEMRRGIEIAMVSLAAERRDDDAVDALRTIVREMDQCLGDGKHYSQLDLQLHLTLAKATANPLYPLLIEAFRQLIEASMLAGIGRWEATPELRRVQDLHEAIVDAVVAGDPEGAAEAMAQHFDDALAAILSPTGMADA